MKFFITIFFVFIACSSLFSQPSSSNHVVSVELLALRLGSIGVTYEHRRTPGKSLVFNAGIIGLWRMPSIGLGFGSEWESIYDYRNSVTNVITIFDGFGEVNGDSESLNTKSIDRGLYFKIGPKWKIGNKEKITGFYFHPFFSLSHFTDELNYRSSFYPYAPSFPNEIVTYSIRRRRFTSIGLIGSLGYQIKVSDPLILELNAGLGYAQNLDFTKGERQNYNEPQPHNYHEPTVGEYLIRYGHGSLGSSGVSPAIAVHIGLSLGVEF